MTTPQSDQFILLTLLLLGLTAFQAAPRVLALVISGKWSPKQCKPSRYYITTLANFAVSVTMLAILLCLFTPAQIVDELNLITASTDSMGLWMWIIIGTHVVTVIVTPLFILQFYIRSKKLAKSNSNKPTPDEMDDELYWNIQRRGANRTP